MKTAIWILAALLLCLWSLLTWCGYALIDGSGSFLLAQTEWVSAHPDIQYWLAWAVRLLEGAGLIVVWIVWAIGALAILAGALLVPRAIAFGRRMVGEVGRR